MRHFSLAVICGLAIAALSSAAALASPPNLTGSWSVSQTGRNGTTSSTVKVTQSGNGIVGQSSNGNGYTGTFVSDTQINGTWHGPGGAGWLTIYVTPNGHSFNGEWGYHGREPSGTFVGNKFLPPARISAAGKWNVTIAGTRHGSFEGPMTCTQSGPSTVCHIQNVVINGRFRTKDKVRARWSDGSRSGWFSFWFNGDNNSFNGQWGNGADTTPPVGRVIGQRSLGG